MNIAGNCPVHVYLGQDEKFYQSGFNLTIQYSSQLSPVLLGVIPNALAINQKVCFWTKPQVWTIRNTSNFMIGNYQCNPYDLYEDKLLTSEGYNLICCDTYDMEGGYYSVNHLVNPYGKTVDHPFLTYIDINNKTYQFAVIPEIYSLSFHKASYYGVKGVTISGRGFSNTQANDIVMLDDQQCTVTSVSSTSIVCDLAQDARVTIPTLHTDHSGLNLQIWFSGFTDLTNFIANYGSTTAD